MSLPLYVAALLGDNKGGGLSKTEQVLIFGMMAFEVLAIVILASLLAWMWLA